MPVSIRNANTHTTCNIYFFRIHFLKHASFDQCLDLVPDIPIRLINGSNNSSGRVELSINNQWGTICGSGFWDDEDATVLCRMLNHTSGRALRYGQFGAGDGPIWIAYLRCQGDEESIFNCPMSFNEQRSTLSGMFIPRNGQRHMCFSHNSDAAVQCYDSGTCA